MMTEATLRLFAYGTLQQPEVQLATCGRRLEGRPDVLTGYRLAPLRISSAEVVALSGKEVHAIARRSGEPADRVRGVAYAMTPAELEATDRYEVDAYTRVEVELESGLRAFVYVGPAL